jgi:beta-ribofuranosylaminobenzene 5'-phosphate synthase
LIWQVSAPSRLHFGLIDLNGDQGRIDGGAGVALSHPRVVVKSRRGRGRLDLPDEAAELLQGLADRLQIDLASLDVELSEGFSPHVGLGSHTQLALALGSAISLAAGQERSLRSLAEAAGRGGTSGIGVNVFDKGGLVIDGGHTFGPGKEKERCLPSSASQAGVAPLLARYELPESWRFALVTPRSEPGAHGTREVSLFEEAFPLDPVETGAVCRQVLMGLMPAAALGDLEGLGRSLTTLQRQGFKKLEVSLQPRPIVELGRVMVEAGAAGAGLSSFGPTVYALTGDESKATEVVHAALSYLEGQGIEGDGWTTAPDNHGARITKIEEQE